MSSFSEFPLIEVYVCARHEDECMCLRPCIHVNSKQKHYVPQEQKMCDQVQPSEVYESVRTCVEM